MTIEMEQDRFNNVGNKCVVYWGSDGDKRIQVEKNESFDELCLKYLSTPDDLTYHGNYNTSVVADSDASKGGM